jgi:predicted enzyme related to lactoylglutathione lyase
MAKAKVKAKKVAEKKSPSKSKSKSKPQSKAAPKRSVAPDASLPGANPLLRSIRTAIYQVPDLAKAKAFYTPALGREPYFDQPFYVGYDVDGFELGLDPDISTRKPGSGGVVAYWRVDDIHASLTHLILLGATTVEAPHDVGEKIQVAIASDPFGNPLGLIQIES